MSEQTITNLADVRPGDWVKAEYLRGDMAYQFEGEAWKDEGGYLRVGVTNIRWEGGSSPSFTRFISATRPEPALPIELGSVILASKVGGAELDPPMVMLRSHDGWWSPRYINGCAWYPPELVEEWVPAEVVAK